jgi:hypothetical protein
VVLREGLVEGASASMPERRVWTRVNAAQLWFLTFLPLNDIKVDTKRHRIGSILSSMSGSNTLTDEPDRALDARVSNRGMGFKGLFSMHLGKVEKSRSECARKCFESLNGECDGRTA